jgi:hypothetical protein
MGHLTVMVTLGGSCVSTSLTCGACSSVCVCVVRGASGQCVCEARQVAKLLLWLTCTLSAATHTRTHAHTHMHAPADKPHHASQHEGRKDLVQPVDDQDLALTVHFPVCGVCAQAQLQV